MGMYDDIICEMRLPNGKVNVWEQTKEFECEMLQHRIRSDGQLLLTVLDSVEDVPKAERPYPDAPEGSLMGMAGCIRYVTSEVESQWSGVISIDRYHLVFVLGRVQHIVEFDDDWKAIREVPRYEWEHPLLPFDADAHTEQGPLTP